jgi:3-oxoacyl-[acyl-carrier protein] reductase
VTGAVSHQNAAAGLPLEHKVAVVTGGTRSLGLGIAHALSDSGALVVAGSRRDNTNTFAADPIVWHHVDVTDERSVHDLMLRTSEQFGGPHIIVANAGISRSARITQMSAENWQETLDTNLTGVFHTLKAAATLMQTQKSGGRIVAVSSCMASHPAVGTGAYAATKAAIQALVSVAALELGPHGILVNSVAPGILDEGMGESVANDPALWRRYLAHLAMRRPGRVEEVARLVAWLAGPDATYINGETISVNGGIAPWA